MARKSKIDEKMIQQVYKYAKSGFSVKQIYDAIDLSHTAFYRNVELVASLKKGQLELRENISKSLLENALDLQNPTVQIFLAKKLRLFDDSFHSTMKLKDSKDSLQAISVLYKAVANSSISKDKANQLKAIIDSFIKAYELNNLEERITVLEDNTNGN